MSLSKTLIVIHFGPYEAHGTIKHKTQRLYGLSETLKNLGYEVELKPSQYLNLMRVKMYDYEIFRGDMRHLMFNMDSEDDPVAIRIINCIEEAMRRFSSESNIPCYKDSSLSLLHTQWKSVHDHSHENFEARLTKKHKS